MARMFCRVHLIFLNTKNQGIEINAELICVETISFVHNNDTKICGWLVREALASASLWPWFDSWHGQFVSRVQHWCSPMPQGFFLPPEKSNTFDLWLCSVVIYGMMRLAAKGALACLLLDHAVAVSFTIQLPQLQVRMISLPSYYCHC